MSVSYPLPGTRFFETVRSELGAKQNWQDSSDLAMLYGGPFSTRFYRQLHTVLHKEFRARRAARALRRALRRPLRLGRRELRHAAAVAYNALTLPFAGCASPFSRGRRTRSGRCHMAPAEAARPTVQSEGDRECQARLQETRQALTVASFTTAVRQQRDRPADARARRALTRRLRRGARLLDLGCGTGIDAAHLAARGYTVVAIDASPQMVARTRARMAEEGLTERVTAVELGIEALDRLQGGPFDAIYSDLGALNCVPDLSAVAARCGNLLDGGGVLVASVMGKLCPWELAYYAAHRNLQRALVRLGSRSVPVGLNGGTVWTRYYWPKEFLDRFRGWFAPEATHALGLFSPPPPRGVPPPPALGEPGALAAGRIARRPPVAARGGRPLPDGATQT
jgi:2-polyprenyl-3-methyl-5-hydroxy-6-metoxy-1,4-benzoquinol methylase